MGVIMQFNNFDGYYNINFQEIPDCNILAGIISKYFVGCCIEIFYNDVVIKNNNCVSEQEFFVHLNMNDLKEQNHYIYQDIKIRALLIIDKNLEYEQNVVYDILKEIAKVFDMKVYVSFNDIEPVILDWTGYCSWCIDSKGARMVFDAEEFGDFSPTYYLDHIPRKEFRRYKE